MSGGPQSVFDPDSLAVNAGLWDWATKNGVPVLGICYGVQVPPGAADAAAAPLCPPPRRRRRVRCSPPPSAAPACWGAAPARPHTSLNRGRLTRRVAVLPGPAARS